LDREYTADGKEFLRILFLPNALVNDYDNNLISSYH
jgi:hypothetical protein